MPDDVMPTSAMESSDGRNVDVRKQTEEELRHSRDMLAKLLDSLPQAIFWKDRDSTYLGCNDVFARWVGIDNPGEIVGKTDFDLPWPREQAEMYRAADRDVIERKKPNHHICEPLRRADGVTIWIDTSKIPLVDETSAAYGVLGVCEDITVRKSTEDALRVSEERFRGVTKNLPGLVYQFYVTDDGRWGLHYVDEHAQDLFGVPRDPIDTWYERLLACIAPEDRERFVASIEEVVRTQSAWECEVRLIKPTGEERYVRGMSQPIRLKDETVWNGLLLDVTDRKRAEEKFTKAFRASPMGLVISRASDDSIIDVNETIERVTGYRRDEIIGHTTSELGLWENMEQWKHVTQHVLATGSVRNEECRFHMKDGSARTGLVSIELMEINGIACFLTVAADITDLRLAEEKFAKAFRAGPTVLAITRAKDSCILEINESFERITGYRREEVIGHTAAELGFWVDSGQRERFLQKLATEGVVRNEECAFRMKNGDVLIGLASTESIDINGEKCGLVVIVDITDRKRTEEALEKRIVALTQPLEDVGGISFDDLFNLDDIQRLQDEFSAATGVASVITHPDGTPITTPSNFCHLCINIIRKTEKGLANCYKSDASLGQFNPEGPNIRQCLSGGLWDAGAGITVGGRLIANWLIGQIRDETQTEAGILAYAREIEADEDAVLEAFRKVPKMSRQHFEQIAKALFTLANQLSTAAYQNIQQARFITERKRAEESLRESERKLKEAQASSHIGYWEWDVRTGDVEWSEEVYKIFRLDPKGFVPRIDSILELSPWPEDHNRGNELLQRIGETHETGSFEQRFLRPDKSVGYYQSTFRGKFDEEGNLSSILGTVQDITERKRTEKILKINADRSAVLLKLNQMTGATLDELMDFALEEGIRICESKIGYMAFLNDDESVLTMRSWSKSAMAECEIVDKPLKYPVVTTGLWGEAVRQRKAIITNDYEAPNALKRGCPEGHVKILRHMNIPVIVGSKIVLVAGVGNKEEPYDDVDVQQLTLLMEGMWRLIERHQAEEELDQYRNHLEDLVEERTKELESSRKEALSLMQDANSQRQRAEDALKALRQSEEQLRKSELELRISNQHLARAQAVAHVGHWTWDLVTGQITGSEEYHRIRGTTPDTLKSYDDVIRTIHPDDRDRWADLCKAAMTGERPYAGDYRVVLPDNTVRYLHVQGETTFDENGMPTYLFGAVFDVTDTKIAEMKLKEAMVAAETANRAKSLFLANMSHELRTPLTAVLGFSQLLRDDPALSESQKEYLDIINRSGTHLLELINDVLDMSKIEAGQLGIQESVFRLSGVLETVEEMMRVRADEKGLSFLLDRNPNLPQYIRADEKKLRQVLINLAGNAVKFTQHGGVILRVGMEEDGSVLRCEVEDTGPGIHTEDLASLFDRFVQVGEPQEGVGLGLYISRKLVEMMGGHIAVESTMGKGTRFSFSILCKPGTVDEAKPQAINRRVVGLAPGQAPPHVLVAEDKLETRLFVVKLLQTAGFQVEEAENGEEAVKRFEAHPIDLILMDMRMPVMNGYRATRAIKSTKRGKATPIIALTASAFEEERQKISDAGADDYLGKPVKIEELYEAIRVHLGIAYTYAEPQPSTAAAYDRNGLGEMVTSLPEDLTNRLDKAISALDLDELTALLPEVATHAPSLGEHMAKLAKGYEIAKLADLLETRRKP